MGDRIVYDPRLMASICALPGHGKTEFIAGCPDPILVLSLDSNTAEILEKHQDEKEIRLEQYTMPPVTFGDIDSGEGKSEIQQAAQATIDEMVATLKPVLRREERNMPKTIAIDTATEMFELALLADHGKAIQILPEMRTKTNYKWKSFLQALKGSGCHVVLLHLLGPKYESVSTRVQGGGTKEERVQVPGQFDRKGFSQTHKEVNVEAFLSFDPERDGELEDKFGIKIVKCNSRPTLVGREWWGMRKDVRSASFEFLASRVYPQVKEW